MTTLQKRIDFLQNEVVSKDAIIKMLLEKQTGVLDSVTNCTSQDKDTATSINISDDSFFPVRNSIHIPFFINNPFLTLVPKIA